jgi:hypothetical protein
MDFSDIADEDESPDEDEEELNPDNEEPPVPVKKSGPKNLAEFHAKQKPN